MAILHHKDGTQHEVDEKRARKIWQILKDGEKPRTKKQREYIENISNIEFNANIIPRSPVIVADEKAWSSKNNIHDKEVRAILRTRAITGREKAQRVAEHLKKRRLNHSSKEVFSE